mmetsp:Transcript_12241/g.29994  ORF Transcript_12241/g.29994 Transcript_12241/m.29994 type:complete len:178 (+) Transcript_12241:79-612(+)
MSDDGKKSKKKSKKSGGGGAARDRVDPAKAREGLTDAEIKDLEAAFKLCDKDGNGSIDRHELAALFKKLGQKPSKKELQAMINEVDVDGNGTVDFDEFLLLMKTSKSHTEDDMKATFEVFDTDGDGFITASEIKEAMNKLYGEQLTDDEVAQMVAEADRNGDSKIDYEEFKEMMTAK